MILDIPSEEAISGIGALRITPFPPSLCTFLEKAMLPEMRGLTGIMSFLVADARTARRTSTETAGKPSAQADGPETLTIDTVVLGEPAEPEESKKNHTLAGEDLYLLTPKKQGEDRIAEGVETPPEEEEADPTKGFEAPPAGKDLHTAQNGPGEGSGQTEKTVSPTPEAEEMLDKEDANPTEGVSEDGSKKEGQTDDPAEVKGTVTPTEAEEAVPTKAASDEVSKQAGEICSPPPEALEQTLSKAQDFSAGRHGS